MDLLKVWYTRQYRILHGFITIIMLYKTVTLIVYTFKVRYCFYKAFDQEGEGQGAMVPPPPKPLDYYVT